MPSAPVSRPSRHPLFARVYARVFLPQIERHGGPALRRRLLIGLSGTVVEIGAGTGANLTHYPQGVTRIVAVEPETYLREQLTTAAAKDARVDVIDARAESLPLLDASVDAVVCCLVLCSVSDPLAVLAEARRVLRPDASSASSSTSSPPTVPGRAHSKCGSTARDCGPSSGEVATARVTRRAP